MANHQPLWIEISKQADCHVYVVNISADQVVSRIRRKVYRIKEAKQGGVKITDNLTLVRPIYPIRPEILPPPIG